MKQALKTINVTCAIIEFGKKVLVVQRSETMSLPLKWEFPGGKIEPFETEETCILREIKEELGIVIRLKGKLQPSLFEYPTLSIQLIPFIATYDRGDINLSEHKQYLLLEKENLADLDWAEADKPIVQEYLNLKGFEI